MLGEVSLIRRIPLKDPEEKRLRVVKPEAVQVYWPVKLMAPCSVLLLCSSQHWRYPISLRTHLSTSVPVWWNYPADLVDTELSSILPILSRTEWFD